MRQGHSFQRHGFAAVSSISGRLRAVLLMIVVGIAIAGGLAIAQARTILTAYERLNQSAFPMLTLAKRTESEMSALALVLNQLSISRTAPQIEMLRDKVDGSTARLRNNLKALSYHAVPAELITVLGQDLTDIEVLAETAAENRLRLIELRNSTAQALSRITALQEHSQTVLEDMTFAISQQTDTLLRSTRTSITISSATVDALFTNLFLDAMHVSNISFALDIAVNLAAAAPNAGNPPGDGRRLLLATQKLNEIINRVAQLPLGDGRKALAANLDQLRGLMLGPDGVFAQRAELLALRGQIGATDRISNPMIAEISEMSSGLVSRSLAMLELAFQELRGAIVNLIWGLAGALIVTSAAIALANHGIIERQFQRRILLLNNAVSAIAEGQLDHPIPISGRDELGDMARALAVFKKNAEELRRSNVELEKFAYVAAHDLRSPLRAIQDLSSWTMEDSDNTLSSESYAYMTLLQERVKRLNRLLNDLLTYARAGQEELEPETIDLISMVRDQRLNADPLGQFDIRYVGDQTEIAGQRMPVQQILANLLSNAVRHHDQPKGHITVSAHQDAGHLYLRVTDDGPGIDPRYQARIFELFQTLKPRDEVEGSGIGLAIVKKLVDRQKGKISLRSNPAICRGTVFEIIIPRTQASAEQMPPTQRAAA